VLGRWSRATPRVGERGDRRSPSVRFDPIRGHGIGNHVGPEANTGQMERQT